jgi:exopolysaccharide biosynthesis polyprenyl glycosylphosphotransferase
VRTRFLLSVAISDLAALGVSALIASWLVYGAVLPWEAVLPRPGDSIWPMLGFLFGSMILSSMLTQQMWGPGIPRPAYGRMLAILLGTVFLTAGMLVLFRDAAYFSRAFLAYISASWLVFATGHRFIRRRRPWTEQICVITDEKDLADDLNDTDHAEVLWVLAPDSEGPLELPDRQATIAVDLRTVLSHRVAQYLSSCDVAGYNLRAFTRLYEEHTGRVPLVHLAEGWEISAPLLGVARWLPGKRAFDFVFTALTSVLWIPIGILVSLYVKMSDPGFSIFRQERVGLNGQTFTMFKFRTMYIDAEEDGPKFAAEDDPRFIRGGKFLRKSRLDEIPQLWNVLRGDMSIVGPRAEQVSFVEIFRKQIPFYDHRHMVRPGLTGWAQVNYGYADDQAETIEKLTYDLYYIKHMSPVMDIRIFWKSIWTVLTGAGAR